MDQNVLIFFVRLLHSQNVNCQYKDSEETFNKAMKICMELEGRGHKVNKAVLHAQHCGLLFAQSRYTQVRVNVAAVHVFIVIFTLNFAQGLGVRLKRRKIPTKS